MMSSTDEPIVSGGFTDANSCFTTTITPNGDYRITILPLPAPHLLVVTDRIENITVSNTPNNLGTVVLEVGALLTGRILNPPGTPLVGVSLDFVRGPDFQPLDFSNPDTNTQGYFSVAVPYGHCDVRFTPDFGDGLAPKEIRNVVTPPGTSLGVVQLLDGFELEGKARDPGNVGCVEAKVSLTDTATNALVYILNDTTGQGGNCRTIVPPGAYDVTFSPPYSAPLGAVTYSDIVVGQDTTLDGALPAVPLFTTVGVGIAGLGNVTPVISASGGTPRLGNEAYRREFSQTRGGANGVLIDSIGSASNPLPSPMRIAPPMLRRCVSLGGAPGVAGVGSGSFAMPIADDPAFAGHLLRTWLVVRDGAVAGGLSSTHELRATITP